MAADTVHTNHDGLKQISGQFDSNAGQVKQSTSQLESHLQTLKSGGWKAPAANQFFNVMDNEILIGLNRLAQALSMAGQVTNQVSNIMQQAEEQAKNSLNF
ncbi:MAG: WXG100 family type VII secretion target [Chloroflexota bacterium]